METFIDIEMPDILTFRKMLQSFVIKGKYGAVFARHYAQDMEQAAKEWKDKADDILYKLKDNDKVLATDESGNTWAVAFMPLNQKQYKATPEMKAAIAALESAKEYLAQV